MSWTPRIISLLFGIILLVPLALIFINMLRYKPISEDELAEMRSDFEEEVTKQDDLRTLDSGDVYGASATRQFMVEAVSPFPFTEGKLYYTPRKWVGIVGCITVTILITCIALSALVTREIEIGSHLWQLRSESSQGAEERNSIR